MDIWWFKPWGMQEVIEKITQYYTMMLTDINFKKIVQANIIKGQLW